MLRVFVYLEPWIVQDGQLPPLGVGDVLSEVGIWARSSSVEPSYGSDGLDELVPQSATDFLSGYALDGVLSWKWPDREGGVLEVQGRSFVVQGRWVERGEGDYRQVPIRLPQVGERARVQGVLWLMAEHEHLDDRRALPMGGVRSIRANWVLSALGVAHREKDSDNRTEARQVIRPIERMNMWTDTEPHENYLLDLSRTP
jgi:hypothetical protein